jgi:hypothetical protein
LRIGMAGHEGAHAAGVHERETAKVDDDVLAGAQP